MQKKKQKILYLITKSNFGGAQKYVLELAIAAKDVGADVMVAAGGTGKAGATQGVLFDRLKENEIATFKIKNFLRNMSLLSDMLAFFEVLTLILKTKPDVLHVTSSKAGGIGALAGRLAGTKKIIFTSHGLTIDETWRPKWQSALIYFGTWLTINLSHQTIMISTETYDRTKDMSLLKNRVVLIKNGIATIDLLDKDSAREVLAPEIPKNDLWIGGIGELHTNKNWSAVINVMTSLPDNIHLVIIGEGEERESLKKLIIKQNLENRVHLLGFLDGAKYLKAWDIFVLPSKKEGLPYVLLEAGLAKLPVIASDLPGNHDIIKSGETGLLIEPTPNLLTTTIQMLIRDEGMRRRFGEQLSQKVITDFSIKRMTDETFSLYASNIVDV
jgi:glycosyltransferase involved in cell wall biosynthesis